MNARPWMIRLIVFIVTFLTFCRLGNSEFLMWDDESTIYGNPRMNPPGWKTLTFYWTTAGEEKTMGLYVPVTYTVWTALAKLSRILPCGSPSGGANPALFHTANVLVHSMTAVLVFELLLLLFGNSMASVIGALLFALHPVQVEPVGWASGTKDLLCGLFSVAAILMYVQSILRGTRWRFYLGLILFLLAILSKPTAVVVPVLAGVISIFLLRRSIWSTMVSLWLWVLVMIPFLFITQLVQPPTPHSSLPTWQYPFVAADALAFYACKIVLPIRLTFDYGRTPAVIVANHQIYFTWIFTAAIAVLLMAMFKRARPVVGAACLFLLPLVPVLGFVPFEFQQFSTTADHYLYLPMLGVAVLAAWSLSQPWRGREMLRRILLGIVVVLAALSIHQERLWKNSRVLFAHELLINPISMPASTGLGYMAGRDATELKKQGRIAEARALFDRSTDYYQHTLQADPNLVEAMYNIAVNYRETDRREAGLAMVHRIIDTQPRLPAEKRADAMTIAQLLEDFGDLPGAFAWLKAAQANDPGNQKISERLARMNSFLNHNSGLPDRAENHDQR